MAYIASAFTAGQTLTAASMEQLRENSNNRNVFTNEAARDAAITSPVEGMMAYLTAPTVPAATGATTAVPTGVTTIYNGSVWVCVTPVSAFSRTTASTTSTSNVTTLTGDGTAISVTLVTGTSALVCVSGLFQPGGGALTAYTATAVSGATTISAASSTVTTAFAQANASYFSPFSVVATMTGLTAGTNTFTLNYSTSANTVNFYQRYLTVQGIA